MMFYDLEVQRVSNQARRYLMILRSNDLSIVPDDI